MSASLAPQFCAPDTPTVTKRQFAARLGVCQRTLERALDHNGDPITQHASMVYGRCLWHESYVLAVCASLYDARDHEPDLFTRTPQEAAKLIGVDYRMGHLSRIMPRIKRGQKYRDQEIVDAARKRGTMTEHMLCEFLGPAGERDRRHLAYLIYKGALPRFTAVADDGTWLWTFDVGADKARELMQPDALLRYMGAPSVEEYGELIEREPDTVPGMADLEEFAAGLSAKEAAKVAEKKERRDLIARLRHLRPDVKTRRMSTLHVHAAVMHAEAKEREYAQRRAMMAAV